MEAILAEIADIEARMSADDADFEALNTELDGVLTRKAELEARRVREDEIRSKLAGAKEGVRPEPLVTKTETRDNVPEVLNIRSMAKQFVESPAIVNYREHGINQRSTGMTNNQVGKDFDGVEIRSLITTATGSAGDLTRPDRTPGVVESIADRKLSVTDVITIIPKTTNTVEYVRDNTGTPQGAAAETAEGSAKPESTYTWELVSDGMKTIAHWTDISRQAMDDESELRGLVENRLFYGLAYRVDNQIINGAGTSGTIKGILAYSTINQYDVGSGNTEDFIISLRRAKTMVSQDEYSANTVILNPVDWELIELSTDDTGRWRVTPNVQENLSPRIWGMIVVESNAITAGTALEGDFKLGAALYDRQKASLYITDSDQAKFIANILTLLAELRGNLALFRPSAFVKVTRRGSA